MLTFLNPMPAVRRVREALSPAYRWLLLVAAWMAVAASVLWSAYVATVSYYGGSVWVEAFMAGAMVTAATVAGRTAAVLAPELPETGLWRRFGIRVLRLLCSSASRVTTLVKFGWLLSIAIGWSMSFRGFETGWIWIPAAYCLFWALLGLAAPSSGAKPALRPRPARESRPKRSKQPSVA